ncbi:hypothetical protein BBP40_008270 [Aspergillus hancockii]|nr:hypothetical protein BBP40_008270 [Aspergillus hancockii]
MCYTSLVFGRSLQGVRGSGIITLIGVLIADYVPLGYRAKYFGLLSATWALGSVVGPVLGGAFAEKSTWRWIFYINFPFIGIGSALVMFFMLLGSPTESFLIQCRMIDSIGMLTSSFLIPLSWGGIMYPWNSVHTLVPVIKRIAGLILFVSYEYRFAAYLLIPQTIFANALALSSFGCYFSTGLLLWCGLYYLPIYFKAIKGHNPSSQAQPYSQQPSLSLPSPESNIAGLSLP